MNQGKIIWLLGILLFAGNAQASGGGSLVRVVDECRTFVPQVNDPHALIFGYGLCSHPLIYDQLSASEQLNVRLYESDARAARTRFSSEQLDGIDRYAAAMVDGLDNEACVRESSGQDEADILQVWNGMVSALERGRIEEAVAFFCFDSQERYRWAFSRLSSGELRNFTRDRMKISEGQISGNSASCELIAIEGGSTSYELQLRRSSSCRWQITSLFGQRSAETFFTPY